MIKVTTRSWSFRIRRFYRQPEQRRLHSAIKYPPVCHRRLLLHLPRHRNRQFLIQRLSRHLSQPIPPACHHHNQHDNLRLNRVDSQPRNPLRTQLSNPRNNLRPSHLPSQHDSQHDNQHRNHRRSRRRSFRCMSCQLSRNQHPLLVLPRPV